MGAMAIPAAGAAIGAMMDKEKPLRGATMGGLGGYFLAPAMAAGGGTAAGGSSMASIMPAMTSNPVNLANSAQLMSGAANPAMVGAAAPASGFNMGSMFGDQMQMGMQGMGLLGGGKEQPQQQNQVSSMPRQHMQARPFSGMTPQAQPQLPQVQGMAGRFPYR